MRDLHIVHTNFSRGGLILFSAHPHLLTSSTVWGTSTETGDWVVMDGGTSMEELCWIPAISLLFIISSSSLLLSCSSRCFSSSWRNRVRPPCIAAGSSHTREEGRDVLVCDGKNKRKRTRKGKREAGERGRVEREEEERKRRGGGQEEENERRRGERGGEKWREGERWEVGKEEKWKERESGEWRMDSQ